MASGSAGSAEELPPALPVKKHRSYSSSVESDCGMLSPVGLQHNFAWNDVFSEPTDCHAAQCPIHQRYDPSRHQMRFFSDGTPPPIPKKRLARTLSLPDPNASPLSPLSPPPKQPQNFDNPLYMLIPISDSRFNQETEEVKAVPKSPVPLPSFTQLSFDTSDELLSHLFSSFGDLRVVSQGIQHRHLLFLRNVAQSEEAEILLQGQASEKDVKSYQPQDFLLNEGSQPNQIGDSVYYSLRSPRFPRRVLALRVHKQADEVSSAPNKQLSHVNVQSVIAQFHPSKALTDSGTIQAQDLSSPLKSDCAAAPCGGSTEHTTNPLNTATSAQSELQRGHSVSVERDLPHASLQDFVQDSSVLPSSDWMGYDRQVCVLLLQVLLGSQHLYNITGTAADLRPWRILLVWTSSEIDKGDNKGEQHEVKRNFRSSSLGDEKGREKVGIQIRWWKQGSPRVVLSPLSSTPSATHPLAYLKSQIGALIQYCLAPQESSTPVASGPNLSKSSYRRALLHLASQLQSESGRPQIADMVATLQVLLWGPHVPLFSYRASTTTAAHNWLTIKRALLVMKLAERGLIQDQSTLDWEDHMCLQYLSFTDPEMVASVTSQPWLTLKMN
ncbi:inactive tyrosine-protein kinase PEAK1 [Echeneis naucrates]|uniref:Uncharacterized protein n=1 Tax=Echeneis naucrates TaxID=173247 RepID=A0A665WH90_ECHNA|nr:uncharacterized protein PEAK3 [Echeneis naucrates]